MQAYITSISIALVFLLLAAIISNAIAFEGGSNPKDPKKRRMWFWIIALLTPAAIFLLGYYVFIPEDMNRMEYSEYVKALSIGTGIGAVLYIVLGFVLSKVFKNGKIGNWF